MIVFPAIDLLDGKVVRLRQGQLDAVTVYNDSPVDQAKRWADQGAEWIHVVDLDGAVTGEPMNAPHIEAIVAAIPDVRIEVGGGIRTMNAIERLVEIGVSRVVLGTTLITEPELVAEACGRYPEVIVAGIDAKDGRVAISGWRQGTEYGVLELVRDLEVLGVRRVAYTDIARDGMQTGVNYGAYAALAHQIDIPVIASGGVSTLDDITDLARIEPAIEGVIVGRALYENVFTLPEALAAAERAG